MQPNTQDINVLLNNRWCTCIHNMNNGNSSTSTNIIDTVAINGVTDANIVAVVIININSGINAGIVSILIDNSINGNRYDIIRLTTVKFDGLLLITASIIGAVTTITN